MVTFQLIVYPYHTFQVQKQLFGVMPIGAFKVEVTSDIGPLENGNIVDLEECVSTIQDCLFKIEKRSRRAMVAWIPKGSGTADTVPSSRKSSMRLVPCEDSDIYP